MHRTFGPAILGVLVLLVLLVGAVQPDEPVRVTVIAVLASDQHAKVDPKLQDLAREVQKRDPKLTGFRLGRTTTLPLTVGHKETYPLVDEASADVTLLQPEGNGKRTRLAIKAPEVGEITYETCCGKYFPIFTRYQTSKGQEQLILAVMVQPCAKDKSKP